MKSAFAYILKFSLCILGFFAEKYDLFLAQKPAQFGHERVAAAHLPAHGEILPVFMDDHAHIPFITRKHVQNIVEQGVFAFGQDDAEIFLFRGGFFLFGFPPVQLVNSGIFQYRAVLRILEPYMKFAVCGKRDPCRRAIRSSKAASAGASYLGGKGIRR